MKTNEEIVNKLREMIDFENKVIMRYDKAKLYWEKEGYRETAKDMKNSSRRHFSICVALETLLDFALED